MSKLKLLQANASLQNLRACANSGSQAVLSAPANELGRPGNEAKAQSTRNSLFHAISYLRKLSLVTSVQQIVQSFLYV